MIAPQFIAIDASSWEENGHPIAIAWSLSDGRIKTTLIQPEDDWHDWDYALTDLHGISPDTLYQRGETCWSVIRELEEDLQISLVMTDDVEQVERMLDRLYDACQREPSLEPIRAENGLNDLQQMTCDERVHAMLLAWAGEHGSDSFQHSDQD
jgi:hypothetical protein